MSAGPNPATPQQALREMLDAGAIFTVRPRDDALGFSFSYRVAEDGDLARCRKMLAAVKSRPSVFFAAFKMHVQDAVASSARGAA